MPTEAEIVASKVSTVAPAPGSTSDVAAETTYDIAKEHHHLYDQFGIDANKHDSRTDDQLAKIWDYAKATATGKDKDSIIFEVIRLKNRLGSASLGEKPWSKVLNYVTYWGQMREADSRMKELEHGSETSR